MAQREDELDARFPVITRQVSYNGIHAGDHLSLEDVERLRRELEQLRGPPGELNRRRRRNSDDPVEEDHAYLQQFLQKMDMLVDAALTVHKPIVF